MSSPTPADWQDFYREHPPARVVVAPPRAARPPVPPARLWLAADAVVLLLGLVALAAK